MYQLELARTWHKIFAFHLDLYVSGIEELSYDAATIRDAAACDLGKWLGSAEAEIRSLPHFCQLQESHERFHLMASQLVSEHQAGNLDAANALLTGDFKQASERVMGDLSAIIDEYNRRTEALFAPVTAPAKKGTPASAFDDSMLLGVPVLDGQHKALADLLARLQQYPDLPLRSEEVGEILPQFLRLMLQHFETEELYMKSSDMPREEFEAHQSAHSEILSRVANLQFDAMKQPDLKVSHLFDNFNTWVIEHLLSQDLAIRGYLTTGSPR